MSREETMSLLIATLLVLPVLYFFAAFGSNSYLDLVPKKSSFATDTTVIAGVSQHWNGAAR